MARPKLVDHRCGVGDPWDDPVYRHNVDAIRQKLAEVFAMAHGAAVQIEVHTIEDGEPVSCVGLRLAESTEKPTDGMWVFVSPDPDLTPQVVL